MADDEKSARKYLEGLNSSDAPWLKPLSGSKPAARPAAKPSPKPAARPKSTADDAADQVERIAKRNRDIAEKTRHLRKN